MVQAVERQRRVSTIWVWFCWAPGFFLSLSISGVSLIRSPLWRFNTYWLSKKYIIKGLAVQLEAKKACTQWAKKHRGRKFDLSNKTKMALSILKVSDSLVAAAIETQMTQKWWPPSFFQNGGRLIKKTQVFQKTCWTFSVIAPHTWFDVQHPIDNVPPT